MLGPASARRAKDRHNSIEVMKTDGQDFLDSFRNLPPDSFESHFSSVAGGLGLGVLLDRNELALLYAATFCAGQCNEAFNGLGAAEGEIRPDEELHRIELERRFMAALDILRASPGWQTLDDGERAGIELSFLRVHVEERNLA